MESAANNVVHHRMRRPGRGWQRDNAQAMLAGLSELHSGRLACLAGHSPTSGLRLPTTLRYTLLEFTRGDEAIYWGPWRVSQWIYLIEAVTALIFLTYLFRKSKPSLTKL